MVFTLHLYRVDTDDNILKEEDDIIPVGRYVAVKPPEKDWLLAVVLRYISEKKK